MYIYIFIYIAGLYRFKDFVVVRDEGFVVECVELGFNE